MKEAHKALATAEGALVEAREEAAAMAEKYTAMEAVASSREERCDLLAKEVCWDRLGLWLWFAQLTKEVYWDCIPKL